MFEPSEVSERHAAIGVFTAIALAGLAAFELLITGGFAPILPRAEAAETRAAPISVQIVDDGWVEPESHGSARATPTSFTLEQHGPDDSWNAPEAVYAERELAGATDARRAAGYERSYADIERDIDALYQQTAHYRDAAPENGVTTTLYADEDAKEDEPATTQLSAYETASPW